MTSVSIRDPLADHLITPQNATLIVIDYQQNQFKSVRQAGAQPISWVSLAGDLHGDWAGRDRFRSCRDRLHRRPVDGMSRESVLMERSRADHTRDPICPVSRPIKNNATAVQLSGLRLQL